MSKSIINIDSIGIENEIKKLMNRKREIHAIKVYNRGESIYDEIYNGYDRNELHCVFSCTKSIISILIGIAIDKGFIESVDCLLVDLLSSHKIFFSDLQVKIRLKDLLTMRSGIEWDELSSFAKDDGIWNNFLKSEDPVAYVLSKRIIENSDSSFNYNSGLSHLLSVIIEKNTGCTTIEFASKYLFEPLGIQSSNILWETDNNNIVYGGHGLHMKLDDLEKIGLLYLNKGKYNGLQLVSKKWIKESTHTYSKNTRGYVGYGYQFWIGNIKNIRFYGAFGHGGQRVYVFEDLDLVITFLGNVKPEFGLQEKIIRDYILIGR